MSTEPRKKNNFVGVRLTVEEVEKLEIVMDALEPVIGERNRSNAIRYIIRHFELDRLPLGKE